MSKMSIVPLPKSVFGPFFLDIKGAGRGFIPIIGLNKKTPYGQIQRIA